MDFFSQAGSLSRSLEHSPSTRQKEQVLTSSNETGSLMNLLQTIVIVDDDDDERVERTGVMPNVQDVSRSMRKRRRGMVFIDDSQPSAEHGSSQVVDLTRDDNVRTDMASASQPILAPSPSSQVASTTGGSDGPLMDKDACPICLEKFKTKTPIVAEGRFFTVLLLFTSSIALSGALNAASASFPQI
eukprot:764746-Hanusia_phi.AAC.2